MTLTRNIFFTDQCKFQFPGHALGNTKENYFEVCEIYMGACLTCNKDVKCYCTSQRKTVTLPCIISSYDNSYLKVLDTKSGILFTSGLFLISNAAIIL